MKAILVNDDQSLRWDNVPDPIVRSEDVLVKIEYAALNRADLLQREGDYPPPEGCPDWMGLEISGEIVEIGNAAKEKSNWKLGDKVCALLGGGGYAEYVNVKYNMLMPVPENCSTPSSMVRFERLSHHEKALLPISFTVPGITTLFKFLHQ